MYTLFHHSIEELESQTSWGVNHFFNPRRGVRIFFTCFEIVRNMKTIFLLLGPLANYVIGFSNLFRQFIQSSIRNLESVAQKMAELLHNYIIIR